MELAPAKIIQRSAHSYDVSYGDDKGVIVEFEDKEVKNEFKSEQEGRPIYDMVPFITIDFPGDRTKKVCRPVKLESTSSVPSDPERFSRQWEQFKNQQEQTSEGTPITEWPPLTRAEAMELKGVKVYTVEQLAALPDTAITFLGGRQYRDKAINWLAAAKTGSVSTAVMAKLETLQSDNEMLKKQIADLTAAREETDSPRRGRPPSKREE